MPIALIESLPAGTALRLFLAPTTGAERWRVLRRPDGAFTGPDDPEAAVIIDSAVDLVCVDATGLRNGAIYHYRLYCLASGVWSPDGDAAAVPAYSAISGGVDPLMLVRDRLDDGLAAMIAAGALANAHGRIAVLTAPPVFDDTRWPVVTVHLSSFASEQRGLGEVIEPDDGPDEDGMVTESEGWLARVTLTIVCWSLNPDERIALRRAVTHLILANLPVFEAAGLQQIDASQEDVEDFTSFDAPVYQTVLTLRALCAAQVNSKTPAIRDLTMTIDAKPQQALGFGKPYPPVNKQFYR